MQRLLAASVARGMAAKRVASARELLERGARLRPLHHAEPHRIGAGHDFRAENESLGDAGAAQPRQPLRAAAAGQESEPRLRQAELRLARGDAQVAGQRQFHAAAERRSADFGEADEGRVLDALEQALHPPHQIEHGFEAFGSGEAGAHQRQIGTGAKYLLAAADMQHPDLRIGLGLIERGFEPADQFVVEGIDGRA